MKPHMENPALAGTGLPKSDLAGASICSESISSLPPIQADPMAERAFAYQLAAIVFAKPVPIVERKRRRLMRRVPA
ncbi:hypothetical protein ABIF65_009422 [Bradyrhizobium japonicum]|uniref:hypothetical protein n=1 Tax=Bradyrhizobium japonicum TaxID=375 RepID=UPI00209FD2B0|nr:hypothetical protein [Bradyrhizobium japonicum]MCP1865264.1 hypothetical protein [Bradyrhizobium japonicum]MCP1895964.1 hypothetical protein [Bradyrhizobium japonicum]MCW2329348.1 hypothetical protein [Bradyrhizobium japonicum]WLB97140.1 hypothetical protein QIH92_47955 [Bradyrhizobium japonicum USDA 123]